MHEVNVDSIRVSLVNYQRVVILKDKTSGKSIPIWIGSAEADSIAVKLQGVSVPRPLTHDLMKSMIDFKDGKIVSNLGELFIDFGFFLGCFPEKSIEDDSLILNTVSIDEDEFPGDAKG